VRSEVRDVICVWIVKPSEGEFIICDIQNELNLIEFNHISCVSSLATRGSRGQFIFFGLQTYYYAMHTCLPVHVTL